MAQEGFNARGQDVILRLKVDGVLTRYDFSEIDIDFGLDVGMSEYSGDSVARPFGINKPAKLRLTLDPKSTAYHDLIQAQRLANGPNRLRRDIDISVTCRTDYGPGGRSGWSFPGCVLSSPTQRSSGPSDKVKAACELTCAEPEPI